jgi:hypothetical protein
MMSMLRGGTIMALMLAVSLIALPRTALPQAATPPASDASKPAKIPDQLPKSDETLPPAPSATPPAVSPPADASPQPPAAAPEAATPPAEEDGTGEPPAADEDTSLGEIPDIKAVELTDATAKSAIDTYMLLKEKYKEARLEDYETLQEFVEKDAQGRAFESDVKAAGFSDVEAWNQAITTVSTTYANQLNDQTEDLRKQIAEIEKDTELAQDMKDRLMNSLKALIPSENNKKIIAALQSDAAYSEKLKQLETEEE